MKYTDYFIEEILPSLPTTFTAKDAVKAAPASAGATTTALTIALARGLVTRERKIWESRTYTYTKTKEQILWAIRENLIP